jgi:hypothetical protein
MLGCVTICLSGCTHQVPDYTSAEEDNLSPWIDVYGDTMKDFAIYLNYSGGIISANLSGYAHPDSINFIEDINVSIAEFSNQDVPLMICYGLFPGTTNECVESYSYTTVADSVIAGCDSLDGDQVDFQFTRTYAVAEQDLPETLELNYTVKTVYGSKSGKHVFKKYQKEIEEVIRIH